MAQEEGMVREESAVQRRDSRHPAQDFTAPAPPVTVASVANFVEFFIAEQPGLVRYLLSQGADQYEADDAAQAAFEEAYKAWASIQHPKAWLYKVAWRKYLGANVRVREHERPTEEVMLITSHRLASGNPAEFTDDEQMLLDAIKALPPMQRQIMGMTIAEFSPAEIADSLKCESAAVRQNLRRARDNLARQLGLTRRRVQ